MMAAASRPALPSYADIRRICDRALDAIAIVCGLARLPREARELLDRGAVDLSGLIRRLPPPARRKPKPA